MAAGSVERSRLACGVRSALGVRTQKRHLSVLAGGGLNQTRSRGILRSHGGDISKGIAWQPTISRHARDAGLPGLALHPGQLLHVRVLGRWSASMRSPSFLRPRQSDMALIQPWRGDKKKPPHTTPREVEIARITRRYETSGGPPWSSFGTAQRRETTPATLNKALCRPCLVYPLASLDVSGQRPV